ncbi:ribonuclease P/MRP protein subunit POP5-like isoform X1 [Diadema antillarum]|uniref:ribonuclease P/MRP protein subunit POP5-like isoform X1 n=1 Tax=Diadema antillarum TaxID=105358 RepID=UPI003A85E7EC
MVRLKNRYVLCALIHDDSKPIPKSGITTFAAQRAIQDAVHQIHGDYGHGAITAGFTVKYIGLQTDTVLIKIRHRAVKYLTSALPFVKAIGNSPCFLQTLHTAGTIRACQKFLVRYNRRQLAILFKESKTKEEKNAVLDAIQSCAAKEKVGQTSWEDSDQGEEESDSQDEDT